MSEASRQTYKRIKKRSKSGRSAVAMVSRREQMFLTPSAPRPPLSDLARTMTDSLTAPALPVAEGLLGARALGQAPSAAEIEALMSLAQAQRFEDVRAYGQARLGALLPHLPHLVNILAVAAYRLGQAGEAKGLWELALALDPAYAAVCHNLGVLAEERGDWAAAEAYYMRALTQAVPFEGARQNLERLRSRLREAGVSRPD